MCRSRIHTGGAKQPEHADTVDVAVVAAAVEVRHFRTTVKEVETVQVVMTDQQRVLARLETVNNTLEEGARLQRRKIATGKAADRLRSRPVSDINSRTSAANSRSSCLRRSGGMGGKRRMLTASARFFAQAASRHGRIRFMRVLNRSDRISLYSSRLRGLPERFWR